ncbi:SAV_2336 N-terminal domain-related protein [Streptomyces chumphonensis]
MVASQGPLRDLLARLRAAGLDPTAEDLADALWLARAASGGGAGRPGDARGAAPDRPAPTDADAPASPSGRPEPPDDPDGPGDSPATPPVPLFTPGPDVHGGPGADTPDPSPGDGGSAPTAFPVRAPAAAALPGLLDLQRALHPLRGYRPPTGSGRYRLDEDATADLSARAGVLRPVFRPVERWGTDMQLLLDTSPSMVVWERMFEELRQVCEQIGVFRDVQAHYLHTAPDGGAAIGTSAGGGAPRLRAPGQFRDPTGRRLTLVVSDGVGPLWRSGAAQRMLHGWAGTAPVAVVQPLPPRLWPRTTLSAVPGRLLREPAGGPPGFRPDGYGPGAHPAPGARPVPVLSPTAVALGAWARLLSGTGDVAVRGAAAWLRPDHPPTAAPGPHRQAARSPEEVLRAFTATASPGARRLAAHLAAAPTTLPVMQLVQRALLPGTGPMELAEVLLGGLLWQVPGPVEGPAHGIGAGPHYRFARGVREMLLESLGQDAAANVLHHCSQLVARHFGRGARNFPAWAVARLTSGPAGGAAGGAAGQARALAGEEDDDGGVTSQTSLFAEVPARVVRWFQPAPATEDGAGSLGKAESLLREWRRQRDPALLAQARHYATQALDGAEADAAADADGVRARLALGRTLLALAGTPAVRRDTGARRALLEEAASWLGEAVLRSGPGHPWRARAVLELAAVHHDTWLTTGSLPQLDSAVEVLSGLEPETLPPEERRTRHLRLGRALSARAEAEPVPRARARLVAGSVAELRAACEQSQAAEVPDELRAGALLDFAAALRLHGRTEEALETVSRADELTGRHDENPALRDRLLLIRARSLADAGRPEETDAAYDLIADRAPRDSVRRCEVLAEWGADLLARADAPTASPETVARAEGVLREAFATVPGRSPLFSRLQLLLARALLVRYRRDRFPPDRYEALHLLTEAARRGADAELRSAAWLELGRVQGADDGSAPTRGRADAAASLDASLAEARAAAKDRPSVGVARALHARGELREAEGRPGAALESYREASVEWRRLVAHLDPVPWEEVEATRQRLAGLDGR